MAKPNLLAEKITEINLRQLQTSWQFKLPRVSTIRNYRRLYNSQVLPKLRAQFNVPLPVFAGMIDTLQADLNDKLIIEYHATDPADWKAVEKANAALRQESDSMRPTAQWANKFRQYRFEKIITGRGVMKFMADNSDGYQSALETVAFEDFFFEPLGGGNLENHIFSGQQNVWRTKSQLEEGAKNGIYDKEQVNKLISARSGEWKMSGLWDSALDFGNRFQPLGLNAQTNNYVGEDVYNMCEFVTEHGGRRWYNFFEPYTGIWVRFDKNSDVNSSDYLPWMSSASHADLKNFASKSFADDLYPVADSIITLFNQDLTNRQKRNLNAKAYDKDMFKDVGKLDEAQYRPDALVPADTKGGTKRISEGLYTFNTPELTGTVDLISWLETDTGKNLGVTDLQQGAAQNASKKVGVAFAELAQVSKRLEFSSAPFLEVGGQLGLRFWGSLKDYMTEPLAIKLLGEQGIEWDVLRRVDLNTKRDFEIKVTSDLLRSSQTDAEDERQTKALEMVKDSPNINSRMYVETILRKIGKLPEQEVAMLMDTQDHTDKETLAEVSAAIQDIVLRGKKPSTNYNADTYFVKRLVDFAKKHRDTLSQKKFALLMEYANEHQQIALENVDQAAVAAARSLMAPAGAGGATPSALPVNPAGVAMRTTVPLPPGLTKNSVT